MSRAYFNRLAPVWDETAAEKDEGKLEKMANRLQIKAKSRVLDVGSGSGVFIPYLLKLAGKEGKVIALDYAQEMLKVAKTKGYQNVEFITGDVVNLPLSSGSFDTVVCYSSFPHFKNKLKALKEMRRVLKDGGKIFICHTSSREEINEIHRGIPEVKDDLLPERDEMKRMLKEAGFTKIAVEDEDKSYLASAEKAHLPTEEFALTPASQTAPVLGSIK